MNSLSLLTRDKVFQILYGVKQEKTEAKIMPSQIGEKKKNKSYEHRQLHHKNIRTDAEGAEREIIKGAKETIKNFKPRMAIAAYHLPDDKKVIPELILSIRDDYKYKLVNKGEEKDSFFF